MNRFMLAIMMTALLAVSVFAQATGGRLSGTVSGPDGVLPGATVVVTDTKTNREFTAVTDKQGSFLIPQLEIGNYAVKITATGFKTYSTTVKVNVGQEYSLPAELEIGGVSETVTVTGGQDIVNSTNAQLGSTVSERQINDLPLNGRNPLSLILLQAGTSSNPSQGTSINGFRTSSSNIVQDGINVQDNFIRSNATDFSPGRASVGNVEEFTVITQAGADRGFGGPQIELATPRGQNRFSGEAFAFNRNSEFASRGFFNNGLVPFINQNQFGGKLKGPIVKDKLFFFGYYEGLRRRQNTTQLNTVLTPTARAGVFRYIDNAGVTQTIGNIFSVGAGTNAPTAINTAIVSRFLQNLPAGNSTETGDGINTTGYRFSQKSPTDRNQGTGRIDWDFNSKNNINGIYDYSKEANLRADIDNSFNLIPTVTQPALNKRLALSWTNYDLGGVVNQLRGGFFFSDPFFKRTQAAPSSFVTPNVITNPEVQFLDQGRSTKTFNIQDTADYIWGSHNFRFGGSLQVIDIEAVNDAGIVPVYGIGVNLNTPQISAANFANTALFPGGISNNQRTTANAIYGLLGGIVGTGTQSFNVTSQTSGYVPGATQSRQFRQKTLAFFFNDQWKVKSNFTLTLGLRYDLYGSLKSKNGLFFEPEITDIDNPVASILNPNGRYQFIGGNASARNRFFKTDTNNFAPVINFAYSPNFGGTVGKFLFGGEGKTVIRGGFRFSYVNDEAVRSPDSSLGGNAGLNTAVSALNGTSPSLNDRLGSPLAPIVTPVFNGSRTFADNNSPSFNRFGTVFAVDPNIQTPRVSEWNVGYSREIGYNIGIEFRYVGSYSNNLWRAIDYNQVIIGSNGFLADFNRARANFQLTGNAACTTAGCQTLTVFPNLASGGLLTNATVTNNLVLGQPADLALVYVQNGLTGTVNFLPNANTGVADLLQGDAVTKYNSFQTEVRRRFSNGFDLQANYSFSKNLTNSVGTGQTRFEPLLDIANPGLENSRADFDQTHIFNLNLNYELPFGKGKKFLNTGGIVNAIFGGWQSSNIIRWASGAPITITDARGTLNRVGRSARQTALTSLSKAELKKLAGVFKTPNGVFFLDPSVLGRNPDGTLKAGSTGRGANGFGSTAFSGQVFFNNAPGQTSGLERAIFNGPTTFNWDMSLIKSFRITENAKFRIQADGFNLLNNVNFTPGQLLDVNGANFGRITTALGGDSNRVFQFAARFIF
jgi:hypothetical protein